MKRLPEQLVVLFLLTGLALSQHEFSFRRPYNTDPNNIELLCDNTTTGEHDRNTLFLLNRRPVTLPNAKPIPSGGLLFVITRTLEGEYACGTVTEHRITLSNSKKIVALPDNSPPGTTMFFANSGSTATLDCPVSPGSLTSKYYVTWRNASNPNITFYQTFPPRLFKTKQPFQLTEHYTLNSQNFSLSISDVSSKDAGLYQCVLGVEDPQEPDTDYIYSQTQDTELELSIFTPPQFISQPKSQDMTNGSSVTFTCSVFSSPLSSHIKWRHRGRIVEEGNSQGYAINTTTSNMEGGSVTNSSLTIVSPTGFDSGEMVCIAECTTLDSVTVRNTSGAAVLSVLDGLAGFTLLPLKSGGFVLQVTIKAPLLTETRLRMVYTDAKDTTLVTSRLSESSYFNTTMITHIECGERVPYDRYKLKVGLVHRDIEGPLFELDNNVHGGGKDTLQQPLLDENSKDNVGFHIQVMLSYLIGGILTVFGVLTIFTCYQARKKKMNTLS